MESAHLDDIQFNAGDMIVDLKYKRVGILLVRSQVIAPAREISTSDRDKSYWAWRIAWTQPLRPAGLINMVLGRHMDQISTEWLMINNVQEGTYLYHANE